ncbi:MAG: hypothetical protein EA411_00840 [Saprospirales bacterium]|nr:MAG: hypothetical protein EA411_00840 [Saprospirales bacterium]
MKRSDKSTNGEQPSNVELFMALREEVKPYIPLLSKASDEIIKSEVSRYPIFALSKEDIPFGVKLVVRGGRSGPWNVNASMLEEFVGRKLIMEENAADFISTYKDPRTYLCLFVLSELGAQFIFIPRKLHD